MTHSIGILHPGEMGISLAASALHSGHDVFWCAAGRSQATRQRADSLGLKSLPTLQALCDACNVLIAVCPPHGAQTLASDVLACHYQGVYADVNAISPASVRTIASNMETNGVTFVDGGIIGLPATSPGTTWLYLSGEEAEKVALCFQNGPFETSILGNEIGQASGLKMCFAANSKGTAALHTSILCAAEELGVRQALEQQWDVYTPGFTEKSQARIKQVARKAWRFSGEMEEIAATLAACGLPPEFFKAAAEIYNRQASFKDSKEQPTIEEVLKTVSEKSE